jgi:hypothetical protein
MAAVDMKEELERLYLKVPRTPVLVRVPTQQYLMVDGTGDPNTSQDFREAIQALYGLAYTLKFELKGEGLDFTVMPLEGLFHAKDPAVFLEGRKKEWRWTLMIHMPKGVSAKRLASARKALMEKRKLSTMPDVRLERFSEGLCAQVLHVGPYAAEKPTIEGLHAFLREQGCTFAGAHHEIYLGDPNRTAPARLKTIVRQPVRRLSRRAS